MRSERLRTSQACVPCAQRKTKCDGATPSCVACQRSAKRCHYGISKRNKAQKRDASQRFESSATPTDSPNATVTFDQSTESSSSLATHGQCNTDDDHVNGIFTRQTPRPPARPAPRDERTRHVGHVDFCIDRDVGARLIGTYLDSIHPIWPILYTPQYGPNSWADTLPQPVLYAIYAIAACIELGDNGDSKVTSPSLLFDLALLSMQRSSDGQAHHMSQFHPLHFLRPSVDSCQALVILSLQQHGIGEVSNAAILCSLAAGMAIQLRLNETPPSGTGHATREIASRVWWNLFILDKMLQIELGRPFRLRSEDANMCWPSTSEADEFQLIDVPQANTSRLVTTKTFAMSGFEMTIKLVLIMETIFREVCSVSSKQRICYNLEAAEPVRRRLCKELQDYQASLELSNLSIRCEGGFRSTVPPVAVINSIWTMAATIMLNKPFFQYWREMEWSPADLTDVKTHPLQLCLVSASEVCAILSAYSAYLVRFPCDIIFPIVISAAAIWQFRTDFNETEAASQLDTCVKCLSVVSKCWHNAGMYRKKLLTEMTHSSNATPAGNDASVQNNAHASTLLNNSYLTSPSASTASATFPRVGDVSNEAASAEQTASFLELLDDQIDWLVSPDGSFRHFLESQLSRVSSPCINT